MENEPISQLSQDAEVESSQESPQSEFFGDAYKLRAQKEQVLSLQEEQKILETQVEQAESVKLSYEVGFCKSV